MTLEKAIKYIQEMADCGEFIHAQGYLDAIKLGIEALKEVVDARSHGGRLSVGPLEGETEE